jgi:hypothetical protein
MNQTMLALIVGLAVCGCAAKRTYSTLVQIAPAKEPGKYLVAAVVSERTTTCFGTQFRRLACPIVTCEPGKVVSGAKTTHGAEVTIEAHVAKPGEKKETECLLTIKRRGKIMASSRILLPALVPR